MFSSGNDMHACQYSYSYVFQLHRQSRFIRRAGVPARTATAAAPASGRYTHAISCTAAAASSVTVAESSI